MLKIKIAHTINPVKVEKSSDLFVAQPVTFETMRVAKEFVKKTVDVKVYSIQYQDEERVLLPECFIRVPNIEKSISDYKKFEEKKSCFN